MKYKIQWHHRLSDQTGVDDTIFDDGNIEQVLGTLRNANPMLIFTKVPIEAEFNTGKKQIEVKGFVVRKDFLLSDKPPFNFVVPKGTKLEVGTFEGKQAVILNLAGNKLPFDPKVFQNPEVEQYFDKLE